jgi:hypothetical protein
MSSTEIQKRLAIDQHSEQAAQFAERYRELNENAYRSCFAYSRKRLAGLLDSYLPRHGMDFDCWTPVAAQDTTWSA